MAENYKHLYQSMAKVVEEYQDIIVPRFRQTIDDLRSENARLSRKNTELETQIRRMVADQAACNGCDWRESDGQA